MLIKKGSLVKGFDPQAMALAKKEIPELICCPNPYTAAQNADALLLATEWNEFKSLDFKQIKANMRGRVILDGRNIWNPSDLRAIGFIYLGVGIPQIKD